MARYKSIVLGVVSSITLVGTICDAPVSLSKNNFTAISFCVSSNDSNEILFVSKANLRPIVN